jgi:hypothetical protein
MNSAEYVSNQIDIMKTSGIPLSTVAWQTALNCVGWAYVFGARGEYCTPANRRKYYASKGDEHPTIKTACKGFDSGECSGCKWYPSGKKTRFFDCRGFTYWVLLQVYGWKLMGAGATSQWNNADNWKAQGTIDEMPKDTLCCLFVQKGKTMSHTGFGLNNETVECSSGVQHFTQRKAKWTHWGVPKCVDDTPTPSPSPTPEPTPAKKPTLRRGSKGEYVTLAQTELINKGYYCGFFGADGEFGAATEKAVRAFQKDYGLVIDGIIGEKTWAALDQTEPATTYTVSIPHLSNSQADALIRQYPEATKTEERG